MHSFKNTMVAVALLGLSFVFFNYTIRPKPVDESLDPPELEIVEDSGFESNSGRAEFPPVAEFPADNFETVNSNSREIVQPFGSSNSFEKNNSLETGIQKTAPPSFGGQIASYNSFSIESPQPATAPESSFESRNSFNDFGTNSISKNQAPPSSKTSLERDRGLIAALEKQANSNNQFVADSSPTNGTPKLNESDSSFNSMAGNFGDSKSRDNGLSLADGSMPRSPISFEESWQIVNSMIDQSRFREALELLSQFYRDDSVTGPQRQRLQGWLDALGSKVIFSMEHHLSGAPYITREGETLQDIAKSWDVPAELIYNVNRDALHSPDLLPPGIRLKKIQGPFRIEIDRDNNEMTLFLGEMYATRFPVRLGISGNPGPGTYEVMVKSENGHSWRDATGQEFPPEAPENGYGPFWMGLTSSLCIHAIDDSISNGHRGCIGLRQKDAKDIFGTLVRGSTVKILR
ncbi:MAG: L,D-transpeptidase family protein [Planctomycetota bacterium]